MPYFAGTENETRTCPRRILIDENWTLEALRIYRMTDGKLDAQALARYSPHVVEALTVIDSAKAHRMKSEMEARQ